MPCLTGCSPPCNRATNATRARADIVDHWSSSIHVEEKAALLGRFRALAAATTTRVTLFSGDVHQCVFCFTSSSKDFAGLARDPGFMPQVVSSAIGYMPPGARPADCGQARSAAPVLLHPSRRLVKTLLAQPVLSRSGRHHELLGCMPRCTLHLSLQHKVPRLRCRQCDHDGAGQVRGQQGAQRDGQNRGGAPLRGRGPHVQGQARPCS